jgi:hypothetical protein
LQQPQQPSQQHAQQQHHQQQQQQQMPMPPHPMLPHGHPLLAATGGHFGQMPMLGPLPPNLGAWGHAARAGMLALLNGAPAGDSLHTFFASLNGAAAAGAAHALPMPPPVSRKALEELMRAQPNGWPPRPQLPPSDPMAAAVVAALAAQLKPQQAWNPFSCHV